MYLASLLNMTQDSVLIAAELVLVAFEPQVCLADNLLADEMFLNFARGVQHSALKSTAS